MNKIEKVLLDSIKRMDGFVLGFGDFSEKITSTIDKLNSITEFTILSGGKISSDGGSGKKTKLKKILYKKIKKKFKNKNVNYIIASYEELEGYKRRFISDSLYLVNKGIYIYVNDEDIDINVIKRRYERYNEIVEIIECRDGFVLHIEKKKYKKNIIRDKFYLVIDAIVDGFNFFGDAIVS